MDEIVDRIDDLKEAVEGCSEGELEEVNNLAINALGGKRVQEKVKVKRNRGLKRDILKLLSDNPSASPVEVLVSLKNNVYGGALPVSLNTVMSTMSQIKSKSPDLKEGSKDSPLKVVSDGQDTPQL